GGKDLTNAKDGSFSGNVSVGGTLLATGKTTLDGGVMIKTGAQNGYVFKTDDSGNGSWVDPNTLGITGDRKASILIIGSTDISLPTGAPSDKQVLKYDEGTGKFVWAADDSGNTFDGNLGGKDLTNAKDGSFSGNVSVGGTLLATGKTTLDGGVMIKTGAQNGYVFKTDDSGNGSWVDPNTLGITGDRKASILIIGSTDISLPTGAPSDKQVLKYDEGTGKFVWAADDSGNTFDGNLGGKDLTNAKDGSFSGNVSVGGTLTANGKTTLKGELLISSGAGTGKFLGSDSSGNATWQKVPDDTLKGKAVPDPTTNNYLSFDGTNYIWNSPSFTLPADADFTGNVSVGGTLTANGKTTLKGELLISSGLITGNNGLTIAAGNTSLQNTTVNGKLSVDGNVEILKGPGRSFGFYNSAGTYLNVIGLSTTNPANISLNQSDSSGGTLRLVQSNGSGKIAFYVGSTEKATISSSGFSQTSDERLKDDIKEVTGTLDKVGTLRGVNFTWKDDLSKQKQLGVIAQDVEKVFPEAVSTDKETGMKAVIHGSLAAVALQGLKELNEKVKMYESKIGAPSLSQNKKSTEEFLASAGASLQAGEFRIDNIVAKSLTLKISADSRQNTIGEGMITAGQTSVIIPNDLVTRSAKVFITPIDSTEGQALYVADINSNQSFSVKLDRPLSRNIRFNWLIVLTR
ncbi:MAG: tail fiber domain-containing protein, partial [Candidatus Harrisonbacteria bacterium]|nr:tail fiber domain-containing protein [Candidatus Harrisonbacteria bacterium]